MACRWIRLSFILSLILAPQMAGAAIELRNYSQYLTSVQPDATTKEITLFAGRTSNDCTVGNPSFTDVNNTCNSCAKLAGTTIGTTACNANEIHQSLGFSITLKSTDAADYASCSKVIVARVVGSTNNMIEADTVTSYQTGVANQDVTAVFRWGTICNKLSSNGSCEKSFDQKLEFSFDPQCTQQTLTTGGPQFRIRFRYVAASPPMTLGCNDSAPGGAYEGICDYSVFPGDKKAFIRDVGGVTTNDFYVPNLEDIGSLGGSKDNSNMQYSAFRVYYKPGGLPTNMTYGDSYKDLSIVGTKISDYRVTGLENGTKYAFLGAMVDQGGNVTYFAQPGSLLANIHEATPAEVYGVLDGQKCFIATAAYGTPAAKEIQVLRDFRDQALLKTAVGREFVRLYYVYSPAIAEVIAKNEGLRTITRIALSPVIWGAREFLSWASSPSTSSPAEKKDQPEEKHQ